MEEEKENEKEDEVLSEEKESERKGKRKAILPRCRPAFLLLLISQLLVTFATEY